MKITSIDKLFELSRVLPVVSRLMPEEGIFLAETFLLEGLKVMELTLRTAESWETFRAIRAAFPDVILGLGSIINASQFHRALEAGAQFIVTPGVTQDLVAAYKEASDAVWLPGVVTPSDIMLGLDAGLSVFKFFPANIFGAEKALNALNGPFPDVKFCPTGGVTLDNLEVFFAMPNVVGVGASYLAPHDLIKARKQESIRNLVKQTLLRCSA